MSQELEEISPEQAYQLYLEHRNPEISDSTYRAHRTRLGHWVRWCEQEGIENLNSITGRDLLRYKLWRRDEGGLNEPVAWSPLPQGASEASEVDAADFLHIETGHLSAIGASSLTDEGMDVEDADLDSDEIPTSYVPFRNANLLSMAVSYAEANGCSAVFIGAHSEDFSGYPDCRPAFFEAFQRVIDVGTKPDTEIELKPPFVEWSKTGIAERGLELGVPYERTWSCYRDEEPACGTCDACAFRLEAFRNAGSCDPIEYAERPTFN